MRLGLTQNLRAEQRLAQSPQMIQAMKILQCPMQELKEQIEQELDENILLEITDNTTDADAEGADAEGAEPGTDTDLADTGPDDDPYDNLETRLERELDNLEDRTDHISSRPMNAEEADRRYELLNNTPGPGISLADHLLEQIHVMDMRPELVAVLEELVFMLDENGRLAALALPIAPSSAPGRPAATPQTPEAAPEALLSPTEGPDAEPHPKPAAGPEAEPHSEEANGDPLVDAEDIEVRVEPAFDPVAPIADDLMISIPLAREAVTVLRSLDPAGIGARDLQDCLLLQLDRIGYVRPLTRALVESHLDDLALNKLPKIQRETGASIEEIKESWDFLRTHLNPHPGAEFNRVPTSVVMPDVVVEELDGKFEVRSLRGDIPDLRISPAYRRMLKEARSDPKIGEFLKRKIESAKWFIEAVHQRQNTIQRIASEIVKRQTGFLRRGIHHLQPMKMQDVADAVEVHISTVSRAVSGKYIQTPQGIMEMKRFFSGGTVTDSGKVVSQQSVKQLLKEIVDKEDKANPLPDDKLVEILGERGVRIARRTVTKYRKALGIESSTRRRAY